MKLISCKPGNEVSHLIKEYYFLSIKESSDISYKPVVDDGCYDFVFFKEKETNFLYGQENSLLPINCKVFTIHQLTPPFKLQFGENLTFFTVKVQPWANSLFFPFGAKPGIIDLKQNYGTGIINLYDEIFNTNDLENKQKLFENYILKQTFSIDDSFYFIKKVCEKIYKTQGITTVNELSKEFAMGRQDLNSLFKKYVNYTLKKFLTIVRIMAAIKYKLSNQDISYTSLSYQFGYFDQAHFNNDFKRVCGIAPSKFFKDLSIFLTRHQR